MLCHENYNFKGASEEMVGIGCGPSRLVASQGSLSKPLSGPRQLDSWIEKDKRQESCTASVCRGFPCARLHVQKTPFSL